MTAVQDRLAPLVTFAVILAGWQALAWLDVAPDFLLPSPAQVVARIYTSWETLSADALHTFSIALIGLVLGSLFGAANAITLVASPGARRYLLPLMISGQVVPVFALAPLLTLWLGYGAAPKIVMTTLAVYFPVTAAFYDGLRRTDPALLDLAAVMGASPSSVLWRVRAPAALPSLASGLRLSAAFAPIAAVIGEWTGSAKGLGFLMLKANSRMQPDLLFAAVLLLALFGVALYVGVTLLTRRLIPWAAEAKL